MSVTPDMCSEDSDNDNGYILDLSLPERKRAPHDDNTNYKKSLLKRYCKYFTWFSVFNIQIIKVIPIGKKRNILFLFLFFSLFSSSRSTLFLFFFFCLFSLFLLSFVNTHLVNSFSLSRQMSLVALTFWLCLFTLSQ